MTYRSHIGPLLTGLVIVSCLTSRELCGRRRSSCESSERDCDFHAGEIGPVILAIWL